MQWTVNYKILIYKVRKHHSTWLLIKWTLFKTQRNCKTSVQFLHHVGCVFISNYILIELVVFRNSIGITCWLIFTMISHSYHIHFLFLNRYKGRCTLEQRVSWILAVNSKDYGLFQASAKLLSAYMGDLKEPGTLKYISIS